MNKNKFNILYIDIETLPNIVYNWKTGYDLNISTEFIVKERELFCIGYKFAGKGNKVQNLYRKSGVTERDVLRKFNKIAQKADVIMGHNGDAFDIKWIKGRNIILGLDPLPEIKSIDTLKLSRANFSFNSHKLGYIADILGIGRKTETGGMALWKGVMDKDPKAIKHMVSYCNNDVLLLEKVYNRIAPHVKTLSVNFGKLVTGDITSCPVVGCGSTHTHKRGTAYTATTAYQRRQCYICKKFFKAERLK